MERKSVARERRRDRKQGMAPLAATIVLAGVVVIVGAVGYVAINALVQPESSSSTVQSCSPSSSPECAGVGNSTEVGASLEEGAVAAHG